jgi:c-di-GMP-related signal transduction protein
MYGLVKAMLPLQLIASSFVTPEALLRLEMLLGERVVDLSAISDIVTQDGGLKAHILQLAHDSDPEEEFDISVHECIVEIGIERLRESLRETRFRLKAN